MAVLCLEVEGSALCCVLWETGLLMVSVMAPRWQHNRYACASGLSKSDNLTCIDLLLDVHYFYRKYLVYYNV